jgi:hypothetical protein
LIDNFWVKTPFCYFKALTLLYVSANSFLKVVSLSCCSFEELCIY